MKTALVSVETEDHLELPALLFEPEKPTKKAVLFLHGNGDGAVFYNPASINERAQALAKQGISFLALNNRGAHYTKTITLTDEESRLNHVKYQGGANFELIEDCVKDIEGAAKFLKSRGYNDLAILGESTGANKICVYNARAKTNPFKVYVLASPGDDNGYFLSVLGEKRYKQAIAWARRSIKQGKPLATLPKYTGAQGMSAQSAFDVMDPDEPYNTFPFHEATQGRFGKKRLFGDYAKITKPMLVIFGELDEFTYTAGGTKPALDLMIKHTNPIALKKSTFKMVPGASHTFQEHFDIYAEEVAAWLAKTL